jgi:DNA-binding NarL/FixJ family response regulator
LAAKQDFGMGLAEPSAQAKDRVLIVDEHKLLSEEARKALEQSGVDVLGIVSTADAALSALSRGLADAVIFCMRTQKSTDQAPAQVVPTRPRPAVEGQSVFKPGLTARERQVLVLLVEGASNKDVARRLSIRSNTVRTHVQNLLAKLRVHTRLEAVTLAIRGGLVDADETIAIRTAEP